MGAKNIGSLLLLDKLIARNTGDIWQHNVLKSCGWVSARKSRPRPALSGKA
jgi:hypothetical protein